LAAALAWERLDYEQAVAGIREQFAEFQAGRTRPAEDVFEELRMKPAKPDRAGFGT